MSSPIPRTQPVGPLGTGSDPMTDAPAVKKGDAAAAARPSLPACQESERLQSAKRPPSHRPGAVAPRQPLNTLSLARKAARAPAVAVPHPDAAHHADTPESPQTRSHALSALGTVNSTLDLDLSERPDRLALPSFPTVLDDLRHPPPRPLPVGL